MKQANQALILPSLTLKKAPSPSSHRIAPQQIKFKKNLDCYNLMKLILISNFLIFQNLVRNQTTTNCNNGCLRCLSDYGEQGICQICDIESFYTRNGYKCKKNDIQNCDKTVDGKTCLKCSAGFILNTDSKLCTKLETPLENCVYQLNVDECAECKERFYFDQTQRKCIEASTDITRCQIFESSSTCKVCNRSLLSSTKQTCELLDNSDNCNFFTGSLSCSACVDGYKLVKNKYFVQMKENSIFIKNFYQQTVERKLSYNYDFPSSTDICMKKVENCIEEGEKYNQCTKCSEGYYLFNNQCFENPKPKINNCQEYIQSSANQILCKTCKNKYYLTNNQTVCSQHKNIDKCLVYSKTLKDNCAECENTYFIKLVEGLYACEKRSKLISYCSKYIPDQEFLCKECQQGYQLTSSQKNCIMKIHKCQEHLTIQNENGGQTDSESLLCKLCQPGLFIKTTIQGETIKTSCELPLTLIEGCISYQTEFQCIECRQQYYLTNFQCHRVDSNILGQLNCQKYSITTKNDCDQCQSNQFLFKIYNYCERITEGFLSNCAQYEYNQTTSKLTCKACNSGYFLDLSTGTCKDTAFSDCLQIDVQENKCIKCDLNKKLIPSNNEVNNKCVKIPDYLIEQCKDFYFELSGSQNISCSQCQGQYYPRQFDSPNYSFCVYQTQLKDFRSGLSEIQLGQLDNCTSFVFKDNTVQCVYCDQVNSKKYLSNGFCAESCLSDEIAFTFYFETLKSQPNAFLQCIRQNQLKNQENISLENCKRIDHDVRTVLNVTHDENIPKGCIECHSGYKGYINPALQSYYSHFVYQPARDISTSAIRLKSFYSIFHKNGIFHQCLQFNANMESTSYKIMNFPSNQNIVQFFSYKAGYNALLYETIAEIANSDQFTKTRTLVTYLKDNVNWVGAASCTFGNTGLIVPFYLSEKAGVVENPTGDQLYQSSFDSFFILKCQEMLSCDKNYYYTGLGNHDENCRLDLLQSCSKCTDPVKIITLPQELRSWQLPTDSTQANQQQRFFMREKFFLKTLDLVNSCETPGLFDSNTNFPNNCAVQVVLDKERFDYPDADSQNIPNPICIACQPQYKPTVSTSVAKPASFRYITACEVIENCSSSNEYNKCEECKSGYVLKYESDVTNERKTLAEECVQNTIEGCYIGEQDGKCTQCKRGYFLNESNLCDKVYEDNVCLEKGTLLPDKQSPYSYLKNDPFKLGCVKCKNTMFAVSFNFNPRICIQNTSASFSGSLGASFKIENCDQFIMNGSQLECRACKEDFYLTSDYRSCVAADKSISNCEIYNKVNETKFTCAKCLEKFVLREGQCDRGLIKNCLTYNDNKNCIKCEAGFQPVKIFNNQYTLCFNMQNNIKDCLEYDQNEALNGILKCNKCNSFTFPVLFTLAIKTCGLFPQTDFCAQYNLLENFQDSDFQCQSCQKEYYVNKTTFPFNCVKRSNFPIFNCLNYSNDSDICLECIENFFLSLDKTKCQNNPDGIQYCRVYASLTECSECEAPYKLQDKGCVLVPVEKQVSNCYTYQLNDECVRCQKGYFVEQNQCNKFTVPNCLQHGFDKACDQCADGYFFQDFQCQKTNVNNCLKFQDINNCLQCAQDFALQGGKCFEVQKIDNCKEYKSQSECSVCVKGYVLETNGTACTKMTLEEEINFKNDNCQFYERKNTCFVCQDEYYFNETTMSCQKFSVQNCAFFDYINQDTCLVCKSGFHMNNTNQCVANTEEATISQDTQITVNKGFYEYKFARILLSLTLYTILHFNQNNQIQTLIKQTTFQV